MEKGEKSKFQILIKNVGTEVKRATDFWKEAEDVFGTKMTCGARKYVVYWLKKSGQLELAGNCRGTVYSIKNVAAAIKYFEELKTLKDELPVLAPAPIKAEDPTIPAPAKAKAEMGYLENVLRMLRYCVRQNYAFIPGETIAKVTKHDYVNRTHVFGWISHVKMAGINIASPETYKELGKATKYEFKYYERDLVTICDEGHKMYPENRLFNAVEAFGGTPEAEAKVMKIRRGIGSSTEKAPLDEPKLEEVPVEEKVVVGPKEIKEDILPEAHAAPTAKEAVQVPIKIQEMTLNDLLAQLGKLKIQITISL